MTKYDLLTYLIKDKMFKTFYRAFTSVGFKIVLVEQNDLYKNTAKPKNAMFIICTKLVGTECSVGMIV